VLVSAVILILSSRDNAIFYIIALLKFMESVSSYSLLCLLELLSKLTVDLLCRKCEILCLNAKTLCDMIYCHSLSVSTVDSLCYDLLYFDYLYLIFWWTNHVFIENVLDILIFLISIFSINRFTFAKKSHTIVIL
jgi:hypothetical protein